MSIHVWNCRCGRRWFEFRKALWDSASAPTVWCPGCVGARETPDFGFFNNWGEL